MSGPFSIVFSRSAVRQRGFQDICVESLLAGSLPEGHGDRYDVGRRLVVRCERERRATHPLAVEGREYDFVKECDRPLSAKNLDV